jgi:hypothetical protein
MFVHDFDLFTEARDVLFGDAHVIARMVADFETVGVQLRDLFPGHVIGFVRRKTEAFSDEEGGAEAVLFEERTNDGEL